MAKIYFHKIFIVLFFFSCAAGIDKQDDETIKKGNVLKTLSTDTEKLSKIIDIKIYKPTSVKFEYVFIDNSGADERLAIAGPSDNYLNALLYFDSITFKNLRIKYFTLDDHSPKYEKEYFNFDWLDKKIKEELLATDTNYHGHQDYFFGLGQKGKLWLLDNKLLLIKSAD